MTKFQKYWNSLKKDFSSDIKDVLAVNRLLLDAQQDVINDLEIKHFHEDKMKSHPDPTHDSENEYPEDKPNGNDDDDDSDDENKSQVQKTVDYCDGCGRKKELKEVELKDASGTGMYCEDCIKNNPHVKVIVKSHLDSEIADEVEGTEHYQDLADKHPEHASDFGTMASDEAGHKDKLESIDEVLDAKKDIRRYGQGYTAGQIVEASETEETKKVGNQKEHWNWLAIYADEFPGLQKLSAALAEEFDLSLQEATKIVSEWTRAHANIRLFQVDKTRDSKTIRSEIDKVQGEMYKVDSYDKYEKIRLRNDLNKLLAEEQDAIEEERKTKKSNFENVMSFMKSRKVTFKDMLFEKRIPEYEKAGLIDEIIHRFGAGEYNLREKAENFLKRRNVNPDDMEEILRVLDKEGFFK